MKLPAKAQLLEYVRTQAIFAAIAKLAPAGAAAADPFSSVRKDNEERFPPQLHDLARLHWLARTSKAFTILEFGVGFSTIVLADALRQNRIEWEALATKPKIRKAHPFKLFSVDASRKWLDVTRRDVPADLRDYVELSYSGVHAGTFNGRLCHYYDRIPNVVPDFAYLDGPHPADVHGESHGLDFSNPDRTVLSADLLLMESTLLPGAFILVDGRTNNARFLARNFQRRFTVEHSSADDVTLFCLAEEPLGPLNRNELEFRFGNSGPFCRHGADT